MTKEIDNYKAFAEVNLSNARSENESYEDYRERLRRNEKILKLYNFTKGLESRVRIKFKQRKKFWQYSHSND